MIKLILTRLLIHEVINNTKIPRTQKLLHSRLNSVLNQWHHFAFHQSATLILNNLGYLAQRHRDFSLPPVDLFLLVLEF